MHTLHRHFWYHIRQLGLRSQLMTAFLLLEKYDDSFIEQMFLELIFLSGDATLEWTNEAHISLETMLLAEPDPFDALRFHGNEIQVVSQSYVKPHTKT